MVHLSRLIKIDTIKSTCIVGIDFHRLVKRIYINRLVFIDCIDYIDWFPMNDFHCLGTPVFNQDDSSGSNIFLIHYQHHLWREQFRESRETFQKTFGHIFLSRWPQPQSKGWKTIFSDYFNTWQASVTTRNAIGCGIY